MDRCGEGNGDGDDSALQVEARQELEKMRQEEGWKTKGGDDGGRIWMFENMQRGAIHPEGGRGTLIKDTNGQVGILPNRQTIRGEVIIERTNQS